jgi:hypothetical protein
MIKPSLWIRALQVSFVAAAMVLASSATSFAGPLNVPLEPYPVMNAQSITSIFNNGLFTATGTAVGWNSGSGNNPISQAFKLTANFSNGAPTSASLIIGSQSNPFVFAADLLSFSYNQAKGGTIEFLFGTVGGGSGIFDPNGQLDVAITVSSAFTPQFTTSWMNSLETAVLREPAVPEPSSLLLMLAGAVGAYGVRRRMVGQNA